MQGQLFSTDFLLRGITETEPWRALTETALDAFIAQLQTLYAVHHVDSALNESQTEDELIEPVLAQLGWSDSWLSQVNLSQTGREDVPDFLLFADPATKTRALAEKDDRRALHGIALLEAKRWMRLLDRSEGKVGSNRKSRDFGAPSSQMLRYLSRADVMSDRAIKWGILTNGALWRLYWQDARSRAEDFFEVNVAAALGVTGVPQELEGPQNRHALKLFFLFFHRAAFLSQSWDTQRRSFHAIAQAQARWYEEKVSQNLGQRVFDEVFPALANALIASDVQAVKDPKGRYNREYLEELREAALVLLYRLLFVFYAEDRRLLPVTDSRYASYSLSELRDKAAQALDSGKALSGTAATYWSVLDDLFLIISQGDDQVGMPAYNGGLFERTRAPILARVRVPDVRMARVIDALSRRIEDSTKPRINYRDLSVAHLGSIYERLLEYTLVQETTEEGKTTLLARPASFARKVSGSYYTHDHLVRLILDEAVGLRVSECIVGYEKLLAAYRKKTQLKPYEWDELENKDPASQILELKICDPAMGSGHFLVALVDYLADRVLEATQSVDEIINQVPWAAHLVEQGRPWTSPVVARVAEIRKRILAAAHTHGWTVDVRQLDDRHIVRRMILKRVIFGVDKNPMAVELAKVALWLHTFTVGAPLSFLDHHLKCGDSLHGEKLDTVRAGMQALGTLFQDHELTRLELAAKSLEAVAELTDTSIAEAHQSKALADEAAEKLAPIHALLDFWRALRWLVPGWPTSKVSKIKDESARNALAELFSGQYNLSSLLLAGKIEGQSSQIDAANALLTRAKALARRERFFHWWTAFPTVWRWGSSGPQGFDAVIGNPPWDRIKLQQIEWFAERKPAIALQTRAADRKKLIAEEERRKTPLWKDFVLANESAEAMSRVVRDSQDFPLLSGGDVNLYSLFVERAQALAHENGIIGLLTPSGIAADKGAAEFFRSVSGAGRLGALFDFENKKVFFPDIHASFKFCVLVFGAAQRRFEAARCAFYLHAIEELQDPDKLIPLAAEDFLRLNPNTGAAPIFRSRRDAELTTRIYAQHPVLVNRSNGSEVKAWPVKYVRMFDMSNDSGLFLTRAELIQQGYKPAPLNRWQNTQGAVAVPLYEGKMVQMFDHRAADVVINIENLHRAAQQTAITEEQKAQADRFPTPQFWVIQPDEIGTTSGYRLAFKDVTAPTNVRTMIAALVPEAGYGNTLPFLALETHSADFAYGAIATLLTANFACLAFDFIARQKVQGQHLNWYVVEQLPVIAPERFQQSIGTTCIADFIRTEVLALTYTAHDMAAFAVDMGFVDAQGVVKPPFVWNKDDRAHRMARLDALFMYLYGLSAADAQYILSTFPIVREKDMQLFGYFRTCDLILAYLARITAGQLLHEDMVLPQKTRGQ